MKELVYTQLFDEAADRCRHRTAYVFGAEERCVCRQREVVRAAASALRGTLPAPGSCFSVLARNSLAYLVLWQAALLGAGVINPLNWRLALPELEHIVRDSEARLVFADEEFLPLAEKLAGAVPGLRVVRLDDLATLPSSPAALEEPDEDDRVAIMYTGGTTGRPKGVSLSQRSVALGLYRLAFAYETFTRKDSFIQSTPLFHASSFAPALLTPLAGGAVVIHAEFDPAAILRDVEARHLSALLLVPTMLTMLLEHSDYTPERLRSLTMIAYGGSPITAPLLRRVLDDLPDADLVQIYGATEIGGIATALDAADHRRGGDALGSAGRVLPGVRVEIQDLDGATLGPDQLGEICIRAGSMMAGYHAAPALTAEAFRDGWYHSGDIGRFDEDGYLYVVDRLKDMIVTGGENVYSAEVENVLMQYPGVTQVAVIGVAHPTWGEAVHAVVVGDDASLEPGALLSYARQQLAGYKVPKTVEIRTEPLPVSGANKVLKNVLRAQVADRESP